MALRVAASSCEHACQASLTWGEPLPGGVQMQVCVDRGIVPGAESQRIIDWLRAGVESGELAAAQHFRYYVSAARRKFGPPQPRPVEMPETLDLDILAPSGSGTAAEPNSKKPC